MSAQDNLKLDEENIAAWNAHDVEQSLALLSDDIAWHDIGSPQPFQGKDAAGMMMQLGLMPTPGS